MIQRELAIKVPAVKFVYTISLSHPTQIILNIPVPSSPTDLA